MVSNNLWRGHALRIAIGITMMVLLLAGNTGAATITVPTDYAKIQWAIDNATAGDTIEVLSGTYFENVNVSKQLTLRGIGHPVVDANGSGTAITLAVDGIALEGFTATGSNYDPEAGIKVISSNNTLNGNNASGNYGRGIYLSYSSNNTLNGNNASYSFYGISLHSSSDNILIGNNASNNGYSIGGVGATGIWLEGGSNNNTLSGNYASNNGYGIVLSYSGKNVLRNNIMTGNRYNFDLSGSSDLDLDNQIDTTNQVDEKPVYYIKGAIDMVYDSDTHAGTFTCISCVNVTLKNLDLKNNFYGIFFWNTTRSKIQNVNVSNNYNGIILSSSSNNTLIGNNVNFNSFTHIAHSFGSGIDLTSSSDNSLIANNASYNGGSGISISSSNNNMLVGNNVSNTMEYFNSGISLSYSSYNTLNGNTVHSNNGNGVGLYSSSNNTLNDNNISNNRFGITLKYSYDGASNNNKIYNNIFNNTENILFESSYINNWNITRQSGTNILGGPYLGGNFWANPSRTGLSQICLDENSDGICDSPYVLDANNTDYLPLSHKPSITFSNPTPANGANMNQNYALINTTVTDSSTAFIDWNRSLAGWWRFNNESGENPSFFRDWSIWGNNATCLGGNCPSLTSGKFRNALSFDGINDYVDAGSGERLDIIDAITIETWINPAVVAPTLKGGYDTAGYSQGVAVAGHYAYVADRDNGLVIVDVSNPAVPTLKGMYDTAGSSYGVAVAGNYAYVADGSNGLVIVDVTNPAAPTLKGMYNTAGYSYGVAVAGNYAYVADSDNGLVIVDVSNPAAPTLKGRYDTAGWSYGVATAGNYAYVADASNGLVIVDVSNPATPTLKSSYSSYPAGWSYGVATAGNYAYVADYSNGLLIVNVTNPAAPTLKGSYSSHPAGVSYGVAVSGNYAYVADSDNGLVIVDVSNPAAPTLIGSYDTAGYSQGVATTGNYTYVADASNGLVIVNVTNPASQEKCWDGVSGNYGVMSKVSAPANSVNWSWQLRYGAPGGGCYLGFDFNGNPEGSRWVTVKQNLTAGQWYHIAGTFNGTDIKSYVNGNLTDTNKISAIKGYRNRLLIGNDGWTNLFNGKIDEVRIHKRALSPEEIKASYDAGIYRLYRNFTNLSEGVYNYQAYAQNLAGNVNHTEERTLNLIVTPTPTATPTPTPSAGTVTRNFSSAIVAAVATITVTLTAAPATTFDSPGYQVIETIPAGFTYLGTTAVGSLEGNVITLTQVGNSPITYTLRAPSDNGSYIISGTFKDQISNIGIVSGSTNIRVGAGYDANGDGRIDRNEAIQAVIDYFNGIISRQEAIDVVILYFSQG